MIISSSLDVLAPEARLTKKYVSVGYRRSRGTQYDKLKRGFVYEDNISAR